MPPTLTTRRTPLTQTTSKRAPVKDAKDAAWLESQLAPIREILRMKTYTILGSFSMVNVAAPNGDIKTMNFRKVGPLQENSGPYVARANERDLYLIVSQWMGIPPRIDPIGQPCDQCQAQCDICMGKKEIQCNEQYCGGCGTQHLPEFHFDDGSGAAGEQTCHGCPTCKTCHGTKLMRCEACLGTGNRPTGKKDQSIAEYRVSNLCPTCQGRRFLAKEVLIPEMDFSCGMVGGKMALGPIVRFSLHPTSNAANPRKILMYNVREDDKGDPMVLILDRANAPCQAFLLGGFCYETQR